MSKKFELNPNWFKTFSRKRFYFVNVFPKDKQSADKYADELRKQGYLVRVLKPFAVYGSAYSLWAYRR